MYQREMLIVIFPLSCKFNVLTFSNYSYLASLHDVYVSSLTF